MLGQEEGLQFSVTFFDSMKVILNVCYFVIFACFDVKEMHTFSE